MANRHTKVETITEAQRLQLQGLLTLAARYDRMMRAIEEAALEITGEEIGGHTSDDIWTGFYDVDDLLHRLAIEVV